MKYRQHRANGHSRFTAATLAVPIELFLAVGAAIGLLVGLSGCGETEIEKARGEKMNDEIAQQTLDNGEFACRDGVQYFVFYNTHGRSVTPRMKVDGTLYACSIRREVSRTVETWEGR